MYSARGKCYKWLTRFQLNHTDIKWAYATYDITNNGYWYTQYDNETILNIGYISIRKSQLLIFPKFSGLMPLVLVTAHFQTIVIIQGLSLNFQFTYLTIYIK